MNPNKTRMEILLRGGVPDAPPTWELGFQIEKEFFGMDPDAVRGARYDSDEGRQRAWWAYRASVFERLADELSWGAVRGGRSPAEIEVTAKRLDGKALIAAYDDVGVFWMPTGGDIMDFVVRLFEEPDRLHEEARAKCDRAKRFFREAVAAGADFFMLTYDFGFNNAPFVSPAQFGEFIAPYLAEVVAEIHGLGRRAILHSDGCLHGILDQIHATGVDGYHSIDPQGHMDIRAVRDEFPDWLLMGNVACNRLQDVDDEGIRQSVRYGMEHGGIGKRYIFSASNVIYDGMPAESYRIMLDEYRACIQRARRSAT
jgi:uroporphyrinogen decarboxylase